MRTSTKHSESDFDMLFASGKGMAQLFVCWAVLSFCVVGSPDCCGDESPTEVVQLEVLKLRIQSPSSRTLKRLSGRLDVYLRMTNVSDTTHQLEAFQFQLHCGQKVSDAQPRRSEPLLEDSAEITPSETRQGWLSFPVSHSTSNEIPLTVTCAIGSTELKLNLNEEFRRLINLRSRRIGHQQRLALVEIDRTIDLPTVWVLDAKLRELRTQNIDRVVVSAHDRDQTRLSLDVTQWLQLANRSIEVGRRRFRPGYPAPVQFAEFHLSGFQYGGRQLGRIMHKSVALAVAAAAESLYERLSTDEAMEGLKSPEEGLRRAALASCIDRLPEEELREVLAESRSASAELHQLVLEMLDRVSSPVGVETLRDAVLDSLTTDPLSSGSLRPETVRIAARTLVRCISPPAKDALTAVWRASADSTNLRDILVREIMDTQDHRWLWMVRDFAAEQLERYSGASSESAGKSENPQMAVSPQLKRALQFVHRNDGRFVTVARRHLLEVMTPSVQDVLLEMVAESSEVSDANLAARCITERLEKGLLTTELINIIQQSPDARWTERLLELHQSGNRVAGKTPTLLAAIRCANAEQLELIISQYDELKRMRPQLLQQLIAIEHPGTAEIFSRAMHGAASEVSLAVRQDPSTATPEMLQLILNQYESYRLAAIEHGKLTGSAMRVARQLLSQLGQIDHPEARRMVNLSLISPVDALREEAGRRQGPPRPAAQLRRNGIDPWLLRDQGKYGDALELVNELIERDPFDSNILLLRASLNLRSDQIAAAQVDIEEANRLSPGDVFTESTLALAYVRSGQIRRAVDFAEETLARIPESVGNYYWWTQYNTACVYGRALERPELTEDQKPMLISRGMELLQDACKTGIDDHEHMINDPDLVVFHDHPEWEEILRNVQKNEQAKRRIRRN